MSKQYIYKWYTGTTFNGNLQDVISPFSLTEEINSAGSQLQVELGISFESASPSLITDLLVTETDDFIVTDQLENIIVGTDISIPGFPALNDRIQVWEYDDNRFDRPEIFDNFDDNETNEILWGAYNSVQETDEQLQITITGASPDYHGYYSKNLYNMTGKYAAVKVVNAGDQTLASLEVELQLNLDGGNTNRVFMVANNNTLYAYQTVSGSTTALANIAYDATDMLWWRLREYQGKTYWEYSADGYDWTILHSATNPINMTSMEINIDAGNYSAESSNTTVVFDNFNVLPSFDSTRVQENGTLMFEGLVSGWKSNYKKATTTLTLLSYGVQLDNYLVQIFPNEVLVENTNLDSSETIYANNKTPLNRITAIGQTFDPGVTSEVTSCSLTVGNTGSMPSSLTVSIYEGTPLSPGAFVASVTRSVSPQAQTSTLFQFASPVELTGGTTYHFALTTDMFGTSETNTIGVGVDTTNGYAGGAMYTFNDSTGWAITTSDMVFTLATSSGGIGNQFLSQDPGTIVRELLDNFQALGGRPTYTTDSVALTNTTVSYTFKFNRYLEAIRKCVELAPSDWWWRVDPATGLVYYQPLGQTVNHTFVKGVHIADFEIGYSLETVKNVGYFSGGDDGTGTNIQVNYSDSDSIAEYGAWLETPSDNRVTTETTAEILIQSSINQYKDPRFLTAIEIPTSVYDTSSILIGQIIGFQNFNTLVDSLQLQVMAKTTTADSVKLTLAILPPSVPKRIEDIKRNLQKQQTENNPDT